MVVEPTLIEKYARKKLDHFFHPNFWGEHKKHVSCHQLGRDFFHIVFSLDIQTPIEEVFEPLNISWEGF